MVGVQKDTDELIIGIIIYKAIHCYNTTTKSLKWSVAGKLPGMKNGLDTKGVTTDGRGHLFVTDGFSGNRCIQMFSISDGQYLGCLIKGGE